jgi:carbon storage regulator
MYIQSLSRKKEEAIIINNNIEIKILEIKGDQVKIGITAPKDISVYRKEIYLQIQDANKEAADVKGLESLKNLLNQK